MKPFLLGGKFAYFQGRFVALLLVSGSVSPFLESNEDPAAEEKTSPTKVGPESIVISGVMGPL